MIDASGEKPTEEKEPEECIQITVYTIILDIHTQQEEKKTRDHE